MFQSRRKALTYALGASVFAGGLRALPPLRTRPRGRTLVCFVDQAYSDFAGDAWQAYVEASSKKVTAVREERTRRFVRCDAPECSAHQVALFFRRLCRSDSEAVARRHEGFKYAFDTAREARSTP
jgi:hypothetical protein